MSCMEGEKKRQKLEIDWNLLIDDKPPQEVVITTTTAAAKNSETEFMDESLQRKTVSELNEMIARTRANIPKLSLKLKDNGEKLKLKLKQLEEELERRKNLQLEKRRAKVLWLWTLRGEGMTDGIIGRTGTKA